jgi:dCMP deaminase
MNSDLHPERLERPEKYHWMVHAEANSVANAARNGVALKGGTVYSSFLPCADCARLIVQSGVVRVVVDAANHADILSRSNKYVDEFKRTEEMFSELGIELVWWWESK